MKTEKHKEQQNVEWKAEWKEEYLKWICSFANAQGGKIYIGKDDKGEIVGIKNAKKLLTDIPNKVRKLASSVPPRMAPLKNVRPCTFFNFEFV